MALAEVIASIGSVDNIISRHLDVEHRDAIKAHYNISNEFFFLFLDEKYRFYSCGDFLSQGASLEEAQQLKGQFIQNLLHVGGGERLLELGCGWGGMIKFLETNGPADLKIDGVTISTAQADYVRSWSKASILVEDFIKTDLKRAHYDRVYSMGAWEHIPKREIGGMYKKIHYALKPGGRFVAQFSCSRLERLPTTLFLGELFFQGFDLMTRDDQVALAEDAGFQCLHDSVHDYRPSWKAWYDRLAANEAKAIELVGITEYNRYLLLFALAWKFIDLNYAQIHRFVFVKPE